MGNRKVYEGSSRGKCAEPVQTMATAHFVERSAEEEVVLAKKGGYLHAAERRRRAAGLTSE